MSHERSESEHSNQGSSQNQRGHMGGEDTSAAKGQLYGMLLSTWQMKLGVIPSLLLGIPTIATTVITARAFNVLAMGLMDPSNDPMHDIEYYALYMFIVALAAGILKFFDSLIWMKSGSALSVKIRKNLFDKMMRSEVTFFDVNPTGGILTLLSEDARLVQDAFGPIKGTQLQNLSTFISAIVACLVFSWKIGLIYVASFALNLITAMLFGPSLGRHGMMKFRFLSEAMTIAEESFSSIRTVRGFNREEKECQRFHKANRISQKEEQALGLLITLMIEIMMLFIWSTIAALFYYGATMVNDPDDKFAVGDLYAVFGFCMMGNFSLLALQGAFQAEEKAIMAGSRIIKLSEYEPKIQFDGGETIDDFQGHIEFRDVSFKYPTRETYVLNHVSFEVTPGNMTALVGHSGSGKSTCVQLIERFYDATEGVILIDGHDIRTLDPRWLHRKIALVSQEPVLFQASIKENIKYGARDASDADVMAAAEIANVRKFVEKFPNGLDELVGEKGTSLSGGQRQRIAIARAVIKNPVVLVTDEATASLDAASERRVQLALNKVMENRTSVVVAHRLSTIRNADVIYVFDGGEIKESGRHDELVARKGCYYNLVHRQLTRDTHIDYEDTTPTTEQEPCNTVDQPTLANATSDSSGQNG